jgi:hypothetical protein
MIRLKKAWVPQVTPGATAKPASLRSLGLLDQRGPPGDSIPSRHSPGIALCATVAWNCKAREEKARRPTASTDHSATNSLEFLAIGSPLVPRLVVQVLPIFKSCRHRPAHCRLSRFFCKLLRQAGLGTLLPAANWLCLPAFHALAIVQTLQRRGAVASGLAWRGQGRIPHRDVAIRSEIGRGGVPGHRQPAGWPSRGACRFAW